MPMSTRLLWKGRDVPTPYSNDAPLGKWEKGVSPPNYKIWVPWDPSELSGKSSQVFPSVFCSYRRPSLRLPLNTDVLTCSFGHV